MPGWPGRRRFWGPAYTAGALPVLPTPPRNRGGRTNRELMLEMCETLGLKVMNTWFSKPEAKKVTYMTPGTTKFPAAGEPWDPATFAELDLCLAPTRWSGMVVDVQSNTKTGLNSDHFPLEVELRLKLRAAKSENQQKPITKYDFRGLAEEATYGLDMRVVRDGRRGYGRGNGG